MIETIVAALAASLTTGAIIVIVILLNPDKIQSWITLVYRGGRLITKKAEYGLIAHDVAAAVNSLIQKELVPFLPGLTATAITVQWHNSAESVVHEREGTLFVRMRPHEERFANILHASLAATPRIVAPNIRGQIGGITSKAIDLQLCRRLAERLSATAITVYRTDILDPLVRDEPLLEAMLADLDRIDTSGLFVPVFLQELAKLGILAGADRLPGLEGEVTKFYQYLKAIAEKPQGEDVELTFLGRFVRVDILLVAKADTRSIGVDPYVRRARRELARGADTFYLVATAKNMEFAYEVASALDADMRFIRRPDRRMIIDRGGTLYEAVIIPFERNEGFYLETAAEMLDPSRAGEVQRATVIDVGPAFVTVEVNGAPATISARELSWEIVADCQSYVTLGETFDVKILPTDSNAADLYASRKACLPNPLVGIPDERLRGSRQVFMVLGRASYGEAGPFLFGYVDIPERIPARLYADELDWGAEDGPSFGEVTNGDALTVELVTPYREIGFVTCSRKRLIANRWEMIRTRYPRGTRLVVPVLRITEAGAECEIEPGLMGLVAENEFRQAGLEYSDFRSNLRSGDSLHVVVDRVVAGRRQRITLSLQRNARGDSRN